MSNFHKKVETLLEQEPKKREFDSIDLPVTKKQKKTEDVVEDDEDVMEEGEEILEVEFI